MHVLQWDSVILYGVTRIPADRRRKKAGGQLRTGCTTSFYLRIGICSDCCCLSGLIQAESFAINRDKKRHKCTNVFLRATSAATAFFSLQRMAAMLSFENYCLCNTEKCRNARKKCAKVDKFIQALMRALPHTRKE